MPVDLSVATRAPSAPATDALNLLVLLQLLSRHATDARAVEVRLFRLDAAQAAELHFQVSRLASRSQIQAKLFQQILTYLLVSLLLPLGNQVGVRVLILQQPVIQLLTDRLLLIVKVVDIPRAYP